jgi:hypothetical protein
MAQVINVGGDAASHVARCPHQEPARIEGPTRVCWCEDGDTSQLEDVLSPVPQDRVMRKVRRSCPHATAVTHTCPRCGYARTYGGPRWEGD